jgi:hypothetical protein
MPRRLSGRHVRKGHAHRRRVSIAQPAFLGRRIYPAGLAFAFCRRARQLALRKHSSGGKRCTITTDLAAEFYASSYQPAGGSLEPSLDELRCGSGHDSAAQAARRIFHAMAEPACLVPEKRHHHGLKHFLATNFISQNVLVCEI